MLQDAGFHTLSGSMTVALLILFIRLARDPSSVVPCSVANFEVVYNRFLDDTFGITPGCLLALAGLIHCFLAMWNPHPEAVAAAAIAIDRGHRMMLLPSYGPDDPPRFIFEDNDELVNSPEENAALEVLDALEELEAVEGTNNTAPWACSSV